MTSNAALFAITVATVVASSVVAARRAGADRDAGVDPTRPHVLTGDVADVLVRVRSDSVCSGTPITGTAYVVTAAHCVLDDDGNVAPAKVERDGVGYVASSVLVDRSYVTAPSAARDAAILVMDDVIPGPSATLAGAFPAAGVVTTAGFQPIDTDGSLLRGTRYDNRPLPKNAHGGVIHLEAAPAGCEHRVTDLTVTQRAVWASCGLIPGASGGGLFVKDRGELVLTGVVSNVTTDLTSNGVVPLAVLHRLIDDSSDYVAEVPARTTSRNRVVIHVR
jgi:hypothetical protein